jgi:YD repeat-containing protein
VFLWLFARVLTYSTKNQITKSDRKEAEEAGLYFTQDKGNGERYTFSGAETSLLRNLLNIAAPARGNALQTTQMTWKETYTYDRNGNRITKTTPWGTIRYEYDAENRLVKLEKSYPIL